MIHCSAFPGAFSSDLSDVHAHEQVLGWSSNGSDVAGQVFTQLEISAQLASKLSHRIGYYL